MSKQRREVCAFGEVYDVVAVQDVRAMAATRGLLLESIMDTAARKGRVVVFPSLLVVEGSSPFRASRTVFVRAMTAPRPDWKRKSHQRSMA